MNKRETVNKQVLRTREWVFNALLELLDTMPYDKIKIKDIVAGAGIARQTFYRNYTGKDDIVVKYFQDCFYAYLETIDETPMNEEDSFTMTYELFYRHKDEILKLKQAGLEHMIFSFLLEQSRRIVNQVDTCLTGVDAYKKRVEIIYQLGGLLSVLIEWTAQGMTIPPEEMGKIVQEMSRHFKNSDVYIADYWQMRGDI